MREKRDVGNLGRIAAKQQRVRYSTNRNIIHDHIAQPAMQLTNISKVIQDEHGYHTKHNPYSTSTHTPTLPPQRQDLLHQNPLPTERTLCLFRQPVTDAAPAKDMAARRHGRTPHGLETQRALSLLRAMDPPRHVFILEIQPPRPRRIAVRTSLRIPNTIVFYRKRSMSHALDPLPHIRFFFAASHVLPHRVRGAGIRGRRVRGEQDLADVQVKLDGELEQEQQAEDLVRGGALGVLGAAVGADVAQREQALGEVVVAGCQVEGGEAEGVDRRGAC